MAHPRDQVAVTKRVVLVYPCSGRVTCPDTIGRHLATLLEDEYEVSVVDWRGMARTLEPDPEAILLAHPAPGRDGTVQRAFFSGGWAGRVLMAPINGDIFQCGFLHPYVHACDAFLALMGRMWVGRLATSPFRSWLGKMIPIDLAVDPAEFPFRKSAFSPMGRRRVLFVGHSGWPKNTKLLEQVIRHSRHLEFGWIGRGKGIDGIRRGNVFGYRDLGEKATQELVASFDFSINVSRFDANPATVIETMALGLIPVVTPGSGWAPEPGIVMVDGDSPAGAARALETLNRMSEDELLELQRINQVRIRDYYSWTRFASEVKTAMTLGRSRAVFNVRAKDRCALAFGSGLSPYRWGRLKARVGGLLKGSSRGVAQRPSREGNGGEGRGEPSREGHTVGGEATPAGSERARE